MKYMGSKSRIISEIVPIIQSYVDASDNGVYYEPFCGGCNVIDHIKADKKYASDNQKYLIALLQNLNRIVELPNSVSKEHYNAVRECFYLNNGLFEDWYIGAIGFLASYNGRFFDGGYAGVVHTKSGTIRDYYAEAKRNLEGQISKLEDITFYCCDYRNNPLLEYGSGYVVYCDPPYKGVKQYGTSKNFNYEDFWCWVREISKKHTVIVSEREAPSDFLVLWEQNVTRTIDTNKRVVSKERLFIKG